MSLSTTKPDMHAFLHALAPFLAGLGSLVVISALVIGCAWWLARNQDNTD